MTQVRFNITFLNLVSNVSMELNNRAIACLVEISIAKLQLFHKSTQKRMSFKPLHLLKHPGKSLEFSTTKHVYLYLVKFSIVILKY